MLPLRMLHLLMLMALLCGADATCPTLVLDPPEVIAEFGSWVSVNCTSSSEDHEGMYWSNETSAMSAMTEDEEFILWEGQLSAWNVMAKCIIKMNASLECSEDLKITLYKNPEVTLFSLTEPVVEKELVLQCNVLDAAPVQNLTVKWYKDNVMIKTDSFLNTSTTPVSESSLLYVNISRGDNGAEFRCEAQLDFGPNGPKPPPKSETKVISVHYVPEFSNNTLDVYLTEGKDVTLSCDAEGYPPPTFQWTRDGVNMMEKTKNLNVTQGNVSTIYTCTASNSLGRTNKSIFIHVIKDVMRAPAEAVTTAVPPKVCPLTLTPDEVVVRFGDRASVNCTTSDPGAYGMGWEASIGGTGAGNPPSVVWTVEELQAWAIKPKCYITPTNYPQCFIEPNITLYKTPDAVSVSAVSQGPMKEGVPYQLRCDITSVAPAGNLKVTWSMGEKNYSEEMFNDTRATPVNKTSLLTVNATRGHNVTLFRCKAELHLGPKGPETVPTMSSKPYPAVVHYKPMMKDCPSTFTGVEHQFRLEMLPCKADGNPPPTVHWYYEGKPVNTSEPLSRIHSGKHTAVLLNELSSTNTSVDITIEYGPSFTCDGRYEVRENGEARMECKPEGIPAPSITWFKDDKVVVPPDHWTRRHSGKYLLRATNQHGTANHTLDLDVLYKPMMKDCPSTYTGVEHQFKLEMLPCKADGNPPPTVHWYYEGKPVNTSEPLSRIHSGKHTAVLLNELSSTNMSVDITIEYGPSFTCDGRYEVRENGEARMECKPEGIPAPSITWFKDGEVVVPPDHWTRRHSGKYLLRATNQNRTANHTLDLDVLFAPEFREGNYSLEVTLGQNLTFACSAEGNPIPEIQWKFSAVENVRETTGGRQKNVSVTRATSTNAVVYICVATNKVGSVSRSVTLRMKGRMSQDRSFWWLIIPCSLILLLIVVITLCKRRKKHGQYSFIPPAKEGSEIPLTTTSGGDKA